MALPIPKKFPIVCSQENQEFKTLTKLLLEYTDEQLGEISSVEGISTKLVQDTGNFFQTMLLTKFSDGLDLLDETKYPTIFIGEYSQATIDAFNTMQEICQVAWNLDTYPTLELIDNGVRREDSQNFYSFLKYLSTTLHNIFSKIS